MRLRSSSIRTSLQHLGNARVDLGLRPAEHLQAKADILAHSHVRKQRVVLEYGVDGPLEWRQRRNVFAVKQDSPLSREFKAGNQPQQCCLSASGRPEQGEELVLPDRHRYIVKRLEAVLPGRLEYLGNADCRDSGALFAQLTPPSTLFRAVLVSILLRNPPLANALSDSSSGQACAG